MWQQGAPGVPGLRHLRLPPRLGPSRSAPRFCTCAICMGVPGGRLAAQAAMAASDVEASSRSKRNSLKRFRAGSTQRPPGSNSTPGAEENGPGDGMDLRTRCRCMTRLLGTGSACACVQALDAHDAHAVPGKTLLVRGHLALSVNLCSRRLMRIGLATSVSIDPRRLSS